MKNIFVALALFFALGASAQVKKTPVKQTPSKQVPVKELTSAEAAQKDFEALNAFIKTPESSKANLLKIFETKHRELKDSPNLSDERKAVLSQYITGRLAEVLGDDFDKLKGNAALLSKLTK